MLYCYDGYDISRWQTFFSSIIILQGHHNILAPLLTQKSFYSEWLHVSEWVTKASHPYTLNIEKQKDKLTLGFDIGFWFCFLGWFGLVWGFLFCFSLPKSNVELPKSHTGQGYLDGVMNISKDLPCFLSLSWLEHLRQHHIIKMYGFMDTLLHYGGISFMHPWETA